MELMDIVIYVMGILGAMLANDAVYPEDGPLKHLVFGLFWPLALVMVILIHHMREKEGGDK